MAKPDFLEMFSGKMSEVVRAQKERLDKLAIRAEAGGGSVVVVINGHREVTKIEFSELAPKNPALLADLTLSALSKAYAEADAHQIPGTLGLDEMMANPTLKATLDQLSDFFKQ